MLNIFKPKSEADKLRKKHARIMKKAYQMSHSDRKKSDALYAEADRISREIESLEKKTAIRSL
ncbi:MAG: Lacal_2735 family protein [Bacteroidota bacterium]